MRADRVDDRLDRLWGGVHLADPGDALVRMDHDYEVVLAAVRNRCVERRGANHDGLDVGNQQDLSLLSSAVIADYMCSSLQSQE